MELRKRLVALVGRDAFGVTVQTYHRLDLRILGISYLSMAEKEEETDFDKFITDATAVLRGEKSVPSVEPDEVRDRLLAGFKYILVDEYQDIDSIQYDMISAIVGRTLKDKERKLSIMAVGDDDQSIYGFRGANVKFIRRFQEDYEADLVYLVESYRSTRYIIEASNCFIAHNRDIMKTNHPIKIDQARGLLPHGGVFGDRDAFTRGRVALIEVSDVTTQTVAIIREIQRLRSLGTTNWKDIAVLFRTRHPDLDFVRTVAEVEGIPVSWALEHNKIPALYRIREIWQTLNHLEKKEIILPEHRK